MARIATRPIVGLLVLAGLLTGVSVCVAQAPSPPPNIPDEMIQRILDPTQLIAQVGDQPILAGDLLPTVTQMLQEYVGKAPKEVLDRQRALYVQQMLKRRIEVKLVLLDFMRSIPDEKRKDVLKNIEKQVDKQFYSQHVPLLMKQHEIESLADLEKRLRSFGTSINDQKNEFREQQIAREMISQKVDRFPEITHTQLLEYYREHSSDYDVPARVRWEKLTARYDKYPTKSAADLAIVEMGNQVLHGAPFDAVAKRLSTGTNAAEGGYHDWTTKGALVSVVLDHALFTLPERQLSEKLEDKRGYHIIRIVEREEARRIEFVDAQGEIRELLQEQDRKRQIREYVDKLHENTFAWTIFDDLKQK